MNRAYPQAGDLSQLLIKVTFSHKPKELQHGLYTHEGETAADYSESEIKQPHKDEVFYIPLPFKAERRHLFSPYP